MTDKNHQKITAADWLTTFNAESNMRAAEQAAKQAFENALTFGTTDVDPQAKKFLQHLPYEIIGGLNAKGMEVTPKMLSAMFTYLFDDMVIIDTMLRPTEIGKAKFVDPADHNFAIVEFPYTPEEIETFESDTDERTKRLLRRMREGHNHNISMKSALATAFRANHDDVSNLPSNELVVFEMQKKIAAAVGGVIETTYPGAITNPEHEIWENEVARHILWDLRDAYINGSAFFSLGFEQLGMSPK